MCIGWCSNQSTCIDVRLPPMAQHPMGTVSNFHTGLPQSVSLFINSSPSLALTVFAITFRRLCALFIVILDLHRTPFSLRVVGRPGAEAVRAVEVHGVRVGLPLDRVERHRSLRCSNFLIITYEPWNWEFIKSSSLCEIHFTLDEYRVVWKKCPLFKNARPSAAKQLGLPMHSQSAKHG